MLVKLIMKVLSNLFGNGTKISTSEIVNKDNNGNIKTLDNIIKYNAWNLLTSVTGNTSVDLPSDFNELLLIVTVASVASRKISIYVPKEAIVAGIGFRGGYYSESQYTGAVYINFSTDSKVNLGEAKHNSTSVTSTSTLEVYYR